MLLEQLSCLCFTGIDNPLFKFLHECHTTSDNVFLREFWKLLPIAHVLSEGVIRPRVGELSGYWTLRRYVGPAIAEEGGGLSQGPTPPDSCFSVSRKSGHGVGCPMKLVSFLYNRNWNRNCSIGTIRNKKFVSVVSL
jgi:hypothetical protein